MLRYVTCVVFAVVGLSAVVVPSMGGGGGGGVPPATCDPPVFDLSGTWEITEEEPSNTCGEPVPLPNVDTYVVTQVGNTVTAIGASGTRVFQLCGDTIIVPAHTFPEQGGVTSVPQYVATFTNPNHWTGTGTWSWTDGAMSCTGTTRITATRL